VRARAAKTQRDLLGLAHRAGVLKSGGNVVGGLLAKGWPRYLILASDTGDRVRSDWTRKAQGREIAVWTALLGADDLGRALGRAGARSVAAVGAGGPAEALRKALKRGAAFL